MNDLTKKRAIGVIVLITIGVLIPLLVSRCMHGGDDDNGRGSMRVYNVQPNGQTEPAENSEDQDQKTATGSDQQQVATGNETGDEQPQPGLDAVSPQSKSEFSTPSVHGNSDNQSGTGSSSQARRDEAPNDEIASGSSNASRNGEQNADRSSEASHDYGASSVGTRGSNTGPSSGGSRQSSNGSASTGLENRDATGWVVQVASFGRQSNAKALARQLKGQFQAFYAPGQVNGQTWYRVNVGPFDSKNAAHSTADRLKQQGQQTLVRHLP